MNFDRINQWLSLVANLGVVAGFVMVAFQLQQNTEAVRLQADAVSSGANVAAESAFMGENVAEAYAVARQSPEQLTDAQMLQVNGYLLTSLTSIQYTYRQYVRGVVPDDEWVAAVAFAVAQLNWPFGRAVWSTNEPWFDPGFTAAINQALSDGPDEIYFMEELRANLKRELRSDGNGSIE